MQYIYLGYNMQKENFFMLWFLVFTVRKFHYIILEIASFHLKKNWSGYLLYRTVPFLFQTCERNCFLSGDCILLGYDAMSLGS
jgi:hypothetical protein